MDSSSVKILHPLIDQMVVIPSPSPCTLHWSLSALLVDFCVHHGFDPGGARLLTCSRDTMNSCQYISHPMFLWGMRIAGESDRPGGLVVMVSQFLSRTGYESTQEENEGLMIYRASDCGMDCPSQSIPR